MDLLDIEVKAVFGMKGRGAGRLAFERGETNIDYQTSFRGPHHCGEEPEMIEALLAALATVLTGVHILYLITGVFLGLLIGIFPGLGGIVGLSMLLPFLYGMDATSALAMLIGLVAVIPTSDTFTSVLMGIRKGALLDLEVALVALVGDHALRSVARELVLERGEHLPCRLIRAAGHEEE